MATPATEFLGTGPSLPLRISGKGLPHLDLSTGAQVVREAVQYGLLTFPGNLPFDPRYGLDPEQFRFDPNDANSEDEIREAIAITLVEGEPRVDNVLADVQRDQEGGVSDVSIEYDLITEQVPENLVRLPRKVQDDTVRPDSDRSSSAVVGFHSATEAAFGIAT